MCILWLELSGVQENSSAIDWLVEELLSLYWGQRKFMSEHHPASVGLTIYQPNYALIYSHIFRELQKWTAGVFAPDEVKLEGTPRDS